MDKRIGYHVEEKYFGTKLHQATSFAQFRADGWSRNVHIHLVNHKGERELVESKAPQKRVA